MIAVLMVLGLMGCDEPVDFSANAMPPAGTVGPLLYPHPADLRHGPYVFGGDPAMRPELEEVVFLAVEKINDAAGFEAVGFEPGNYFTDGQVVDEPAADGAIASARRNHKTGECSLFFGKEVVLASEFTPRQTIDIPVAMHEMLHCVGFGHDHDNESVMAPQRRRTMEQKVTEPMIKTMKEWAK